MTSDRRNCPICNGKLRVIRNFNLYSECIKCKSLSTKFMYSESEIGDYYSSYVTDEVDEFSPEIRARVSQKILELSLINSGKSMYDYGFGSGIFLQEASRLGLECYGYEYSDSLVEKGIRLGATIENADQLHSEKSPRVDIFLVIETLEHLVKPRAVMKVAHERLNEGGVLYMTTPNARSFNRRLLRGRWSVFNPPEHITLFSVEGVQVLLQEIGFTQISISTSGFNPHDLIATLRKRSTPTDSDFSYDGTKRTETSRTLINLADRNVLLSFSFKLINSLLKFFKNGDSLKIIAIKA
jgi:hypothetical protein